MQISQTGIDAITQREGGACLTPYQDDAGIWTNGVGNTHNVDPDVTITQEQSDSDLQTNLQIVVDTVNKWVTAPLTQNQFDALVSFAFNAGVTAFTGSTLLRVLNQRNYSMVPDQMLRWDKEHRNGQLVVSQGLLNRRESEVKQWSTPYE